MAARHCPAVCEDREFMQCLFQGLGKAITGTFQGNAQAQQAQSMTQAQINQLLQGQADIQQLSQQLLAALQQQQTQAVVQLMRQPIPPQAVPFALAPSHAFQNAPFNFKTSVGLKILEQGT